MKVIVLAAGKGTRMRPLTYGIPKPLLPVKGTPMLDWIIKSTLTGNKVDEVFVGIPGTVGKNLYDRILSHTHGICIDSYLKNNDYGVPVSTILTPQRETAGDIFHILQENTWIHLFYLRHMAILQQYRPFQLYPSNLRQFLKHIGIQLVHQVH